MRAVELLIAAKVQVNIQQKVIITASQLLVVLFGFVQDGWTALYIASQEGPLDVLKLINPYIQRKCITLGEETLGEKTLMVDVHRVSLVQISSGVSSCSIKLMI